MVDSTSERAVALTWFDTAERSSGADLAVRAAAVMQAPHVTALLNGYPSPVLVIDRNRQIVACNYAALTLLGAVSVDALIGQRPGEALHCIHATEMPAGCGTSEFCTECGAAQAVRASRLQKTAETRDCHIMVHAADTDAALDLRVHASPLDLDGEPLTLFAVQDIADEKRRHALERIFFHDVLNTANGIDGVARMIPSTDDPALLSQLIQLIQESSSQLIQEIISQRDLLNAERGDLAISRQPVPAAELLRSVHRLYIASTLLEKRTLTRADPPAPWLVDTDAAQAVRCLGNLVKNAIEATPPDGAVSLSAELCGGFVCFHVRNPGVMAPSVQRQMFHRSFSTKATQGRGIGSYSVKLLAERYLGGAVSFESNDRVGGTIFTLALPIFGGKAL